VEPAHGADPGTSRGGRSEERRKRLRRARERAERELAADPTMQLLKERIAYHEPKIEEERAAREGS
jgi:hypothetical protein